MSERNRWDWLAVAAGAIGGAVLGQVSDPLATGIIAGLMCGACWYFGTRSEKLARR